MRRRPALADHALLAAASLVLSLLACWPLPLHLGDALAGEKMLHTWALAVWLMDAPFSAWLHPQLDWLDFPSGGTAVVVGLPQVLLARLLRPLAGPAAAMNLSLLLHLAAGIHGFALLGWTLLSDAARGPRLAAALAVGGSIGLSCISISVIGNGQPENVGLVYVAVACAGALHVVRDGRWWGLLLVGLGTLLAFFSSPYLLMGLFLGAPLLALPVLRTRLPQLLAVGVVVAAVSIPSVRHFSRTTADVDQSLLCPAVLQADPPVERRAPLPGGLATILAGAPAEGRELLAADPAAMVRPGRRAREQHLPVDYLGLLVVGAALAASRRSRASRWLLLASGLTGLLAMGPTLFLNGWAPTVGGGLLRLPLHFLQGLPLVGGLLQTIQVPARLLFGTTVFLGLAGAPAWLALARRIPVQRAGPLLLALLGLAPGLEQLLVGPNAPPLPVADIRPADAHTALAAFDDRRGLVETPPVGWDPDRRSLVDEQGRPGPPPVAFQRALVRGWPVHRHPLPMGACPDKSLFHPVLADSAFQDAVADLLEGTPDPGSLGEAAGPVVEAGFGWFVVHTGTGLATPAGEARLVEAATRQLHLEAQGADGSYLFRLPGWEEAP